MRHPSRSREGEINETAKVAIGLKPYPTPFRTVKRRFAL